MLNYKKVLFVALIIVYSSFLLVGGYLIGKSASTKINPISETKNILSSEILGEITLPDGWYLEETATQSVFISAEGGIRFYVVKVNPSQGECSDSTIPCQSLSSEIQFRLNPKLSDYRKYQESRYITTESMFTYFDFLSEEGIYLDEGEKEPGSVGYLGMTLDDNLYTTFISFDNRDGIYEVYWEWNSETTIERSEYFTQNLDYIIKMLID